MRPAFSALIGSIVQLAFSATFVPATAATAGSHRRVLQIDFAAAELPGGLNWLGI